VHITETYIYVFTFYIPKPRMVWEMQFYLLINFKAILRTIKIHQL